MKPPAAPNHHATREGRTKRETPSDRRRKARRAIAKKSAERHEAWCDGRPDHVKALTQKIAAAFDVVRENPAPGDAYRGKTTAWPSPSKEGTSDARQHAA